jgi:hypothetical protein
MTLPGAPPPRGALPGASVTSPHTGDDLDHVRTAIMALQLYAEGETDDQDLAVVHKCILALQQLLANQAKDSDAAMGTTPALRHVRRTVRRTGY